MTLSRRFLAIILAAPVLAAACGGTASPSSSRTPSMPKMSSPTPSVSKMSGQTAGSMAGMATEPAEVTIASSPHYGTILYDKHHFVIYVFSADHGSTSTCYGSCSSAKGGWPPLLTQGAPIAGPGVNPALLGTTRRTDGSLQVTYGGHPLYYWSGDTAHTIMCQGVNLHGGFWYVVNPGGTPNMAKGVDTMGGMS